MKNKKEVGKDRPFFLCIPHSSDATFPPTLLFWGRLSRPPPYGQRSIEHMLLQPRSAPERNARLPADAKASVRRSVPIYTSCTSSAPPFAKPPSKRGFFVLLSDGMRSEDKGLGAIHFRSRSLRQVGCYTFHSGFQPSWPPTNSTEQTTAFRGSVDERTALWAPHAPLTVFSASPVLLTSSGPLGSTHGFFCSPHFFARLQFFFGMEPGEPSASCDNGAPPRSSAEESDRELESTQPSKTSQGTHLWTTRLSFFC